MLKGKTSSGFEYELEDDVYDDWDLLSWLRKIDDGHMEYIVDVAPILLGEMQLNRLKDHIRSQYGKVKSSVMFNEISEILTSTQDGKN